MSFRGRVLVRFLSLNYNSSTESRVSTAHGLSQGLWLDCSWRPCKKLLLSRTDEYTVRKTQVKGFGFLRFRVLSSKVLGACVVYTSRHILMQMRRYSPE